MEWNAVARFMENARFFDRFVGRSLVSLVLRGAGVFGSLILSAAVARSVDKSSAGTFFFVFSCLSIAATFSRFGADNALVRYVSIYRSTANKSGESSLVGSVMFLALMLSGFLAVLLCIFSTSVSGFLSDGGDAGAVFGIMSPALIGLSVVTLASYILQGRGQIVSANFFLLIVVNYGFVILVFIVKPENAKQLAELYAIASLFSLLLVLCVIRPRLFLFFQFNERPFYGVCASLFIVSVVNQLIQWFGQVYLGFVGTAESVADFSIAQRVSLIGAVVITGINFAVAPAFAKLKNEGDLEAIHALATKALRMILVVSLPILTAFLIFPNVILGIFGEEYQSASGILRILLFGQLINVFTGCVAFLLIMTGNELYFKRSVLYSGAAILLFTPVFWMLNGVVGVAWATASAVAIQNLVAAKKVRQCLGFNPLIFWR